MTKHILTSLFLAVSCLYCMANPAVLSSGNPGIESEHPDPITDSVRSDLNLKWNIHLGLTQSGPRGLTAGASVALPVNEYLKLGLSTSFVSFRGPIFTYHNEHYFNDGTHYGYDFTRYEIGDFLGIQSSFGLLLGVPQFRNLSLKLAPYHLYLLESRMVSNHIDRKGNGESHWGGSDGTDRKRVPLGGRNFGFEGITPHDFGLEIGMGIQFNRFGLAYSHSMGFGDLGDNDFFGDDREQIKFNSLRISYRLNR